MESALQNKNMFLIIYTFLFILIHGELDHFYFNSCSSTLSFGNVSLFCGESLNVSLINPTNNSILIGKNHINDSQFVINPSLNNYHLHSFSHMNLSVTFTPIISGRFWSHLSVHTDNGVLYLYLYGVGIHNKYNIQPLQLSPFNSTTNSLQITNPFNDTLIITNINIHPQIDGLLLSQKMMEIEANQESTIISSISYVSSPSPSPKHKDVNEINDIKPYEYDNDNDNDYDYEHNNKCVMNEEIQMVSNLIVNTNYDTLSVPIRFGICKKNKTVSIVDHNKGKKKKKKKKKEGEKYFWPNIDFHILTRPNMSVSKKIKFRNPTSHSLIITHLTLVLDNVADEKYIKIHRNFNKSYLILPNMMVDLGAVILRAIPNKNKNNKPIKTNHKINGSLQITMYEPSLPSFDDMTIRYEENKLNHNNNNNQCNGEEACAQSLSMEDENENISRLGSILLNDNMEEVVINKIRNDFIDNNEHLKMLNTKQKHKYKNKLNSYINGWILLGNLNYSFQQSLFYPKPYWNSSRHIKYVPMIREMRMQNNFLIPLQLESLCVFNCVKNGTIINNYGQIDFEIVEFYKGKRILDGENGTICKLKYYPKSNRSMYETQLILNTNITSFQIPITVYNGQLHLYHANMTNDMGKRIEINQKANWFNPSVSLSQIYKNKNISNLLAAKKNNVLQPGPVQIVIDFGAIPVNGKIINTLELRNDNPVHLTLIPVINQYNKLISTDKIFKDSYDALFDEDTYDLISFFLYQRRSDMTVKSVDVINKYEYAYLAIGIAPEILSKFNPKRKKKKYVFYTFLNVTANNSEHLNAGRFMMKFNDNWISTAISSYLLRVKVVFEVHFGSLNVKPLPIWFDHSFPGKAIRSQSITMYNYYDLDIGLEPKQTYLTHSMFEIIFAQNQNIHNKPKYLSGLITIPAKTNQPVAKIYFNPNTIHTKYGNYIYINSSETHLFSHFEILDVPENLVTKYKAFKLLTFGAKSAMDNVHKMHEIDVNAKGVNLRELFIDEYRKFLWDKIVSENNTKVQAVGHFYSKNFGKIPFIVYGELIMPSFMINEKAINFGNVMVGSSKMFNISVQNLFNETVQISLILPINQNEAIFFPSTNKKFRANHIIILKPYSTGILGPILFRPKKSRYYHQMLYLRNNITTIESFNVSGIGQQGMLKIDADNEEDDDDEEDDVYIDADAMTLINDIIYPLNIIGRAYVPKPVQANYKFMVNELLNTNDNQQKQHATTPTQRRIKDENGGYIYHMHNSDNTPAPSFNLWQFVAQYINILDIYRLWFVASDNDIDIDIDIDTDKIVEDVIDITFNPKDYGLVQTRTNLYDFVDTNHRDLFMDKINSGHYLMLEKKFRATNFGNVAITLEGMAFIESDLSNENLLENDTLFTRQSACIYDLNMFNTEKHQKEKVNLNKQKTNQENIKYDIYSLSFWFDLVTKLLRFIICDKTVLDEYMYTKNNDNDNNNFYNESEYGMNYYLQQSGMDYVQYNDDGNDNNIYNLWSNKNVGFGVIGCEMFPLQLQPKESKDFVLIFNYDLSQSPPIYNNLYIKTCHMEIVNNSVKKSNKLYFKTNTKVNIDINLFNSISALKPLEEGKKFIISHTFRLFVTFITLIVINIIYKILQNCFHIPISDKVKNFIIKQCYIKIKGFITAKLNIFRPIYHLIVAISILLWTLIVILCGFIISTLPKTKKFRKFKRKCLNIWNNDIKRRLITFSRNIVFEFNIISQKKTKTNSNTNEGHAMDENHNKINPNLNINNNRKNNRRKKNSNSPSVKPQCPKNKSKTTKKEQQQQQPREDEPPLNNSPKTEKNDKIVDNAHGRKQTKQTKEIEERREFNEDSSESDASLSVAIEIQNNYKEKVKEKVNKEKETMSIREKEKEHTKHKRKVVITPPSVTKKKPYKASHKSSPTHSSKTKTRTVLMSTTITTQKINKNNISYASRAKGMAHNNNNNGIITKRNINGHKPRKPPRPHHPNGSTSQSPEIRTAIDKLLATQTKPSKHKQATQAKQSTNMNMMKAMHISPPKTTKSRKTAKTRPRNLSDPVLIEKRSKTNRKKEYNHNDSPDTINTLSSQSTTTSNTSLSSLRLTNTINNNPMLPPGITIYNNNRSTKPPFSKAAATTATSKQLQAVKIINTQPVVTKHSKSVSPKYANNNKGKAVMVTSVNNEAELVIPLIFNDNKKRHRIRRTNRKKKVHKKSDYNSIFKDNDDFHIDTNKIWTNYERETSENVEKDNVKSTLSTKAAPFVPKQLKHKYNSKGELRKNANKKHTFSSLYDTYENDAFLLNMVKAIKPSILSPSPSCSPSAEEDQDGDNDNNSNTLMYHVPDGILSSPTNKPRIDNNPYNRITKPYPINYSSTPSPKQSPSQILSPNGFGIDLKTLGYNVSPQRSNKNNKNNKNNINLPKELEPQNSLEIGIQKSLNSIINDNDIHNIHTNDLFDVHNSNDNDNDHNNQNKNTIASGLRLSQLY